MFFVDAIYSDSSKNGVIPNYEGIFQAKIGGSKAYGNSKFVRWADINYAPGLYCSENFVFLS